MPAEVVPARAEALPALAAVAARAFHDELPYSALFPDEPTRARKLLAWFRLALPGAMSAGFLVETTRAQQGMAMWSPPKHQDSRLSQLRSVPRLLPQLLAVVRVTDRADRRRALGWGRRIEQRDLELMPDPHWSLDGLAVDPDQQRRGYGAVLVRRGLRRADAGGLATYLETNSPRNEEFYRKLGFEVIEHVAEDYPPMKIPTWRMVRPPQNPD
jgi:ribosomal protein S18 acetylase RimI-like enzyme